MSTAARSAMQNPIDHQALRPIVGYSAPTNLPAVLFDLGLVVLTAVSVVYLRVPVPHSAEWRNLHSTFARNLTFALLFAPIVVLCCHWQQLYSHRVARVNEILLSVVKAIAVAAAIWMCFIYVAGIKDIPRFVVLTLSIASVVFLSAWRVEYKRLTAHRVTAGYGVNALILGGGNTARALADYLRSHPTFGYRVISVIDPRRLSYSLDETGRFREIVLSNFIDEIIVSDASDHDLVRRAAAEVADLGVGLSVIPEGYEGLAIGATFGFIGSLPKIALFHRAHSPIEMTAKRLVDIVVAASLLVCIAPVLAAIALVILFDSGAPVIYRSKRVGKKGRLFDCLKFRTMVRNADELKQSLAHLNEREGALFKISNDPRITRVGAFLRKYSLDELPQLWNVLVGEMSLVGPRPAIPSEVDAYSPEHRRRITVTPGITGLWQIQARAKPSFDEYIHLDLQYIEGFSLWLDFQILIRTIFVVINGTGT